MYKIGTSIFPLNSSNELIFVLAQIPLSHISIFLVSILPKYYLFTRKHWMQSIKFAGRDRLWIK